MKEKIEKFLKELGENDVIFVITYVDSEDNVEFATNASTEEATDMMIASLSELRFGEE